MKTLVIGVSSDVVDLKAVSHSLDSTGRAETQAEQLLSGKYSRDSTRRTVASSILKRIIAPPFTRQGGLEFLRPFSNSTCLPRKQRLIFLIVVQTPNCSATTAHDLVASGEVTDGGRGRCSRLRSGSCEPWCDNITYGKKCVSLFLPVVISSKLTDLRYAT